MMKLKETVHDVGMSTNTSLISTDTTALKPTMSQEFNLKEKINTIVISSNNYLQRILWVVSEFLTNLMSTSKGRNNLCQLIQYQAQLMYECQVNSNIPEIQEMIMHLGKPKKILLSGRIYSTMSKHRKIFNLFKFIDEITRIQKVVGDKRTPFYMKVLTTFSHTGSILYYMLDNFLWLIYSNIINYYTEERITQLKYMKDQGSFWRIIFHTIITTLNLKRFAKERKELTKKMVFMPNEPIKSGSEESKTINDLLNLKFEIRCSIIEIIMNSVRGMMLWKSLSFPGHKSIHPVATSALGFLSACLNLFKMLLESPQSMVSMVRKAHSQDNNEIYTQYKHSDSQSQTERATNDKYRLNASPGSKQPRLVRDSPSRKEYLKPEPRASSLGRKTSDFGDLSRQAIIGASRNYLHAQSLGEAGLKLTKN